MHAQCFAMSEQISNASRAWIQALVESHQLGSGQAFDVAHYRPLTKVEHAEPMLNYC
jgi:hypothetical protein